MIIFDLDGTLADCEHRRHFVDYTKNPSYFEKINAGYMKISDGWIRKCSYDCFGNYCNKMPLDRHIKWNPDWKSFYEVCDKDKPIEPVISLLDAYLTSEMSVQIWSGRCESVRQKTENWLNENLGTELFDDRPCYKNILKMRPIGDSTPDDQLKERWLDEHISGGGKPIVFVFDDRKKVIEMWRRRGIFVFDVAQGKGDF